MNSPRATRAPPFFPLLWNAANFDDFRCPTGTKFTKENALKRIDNSSTLRRISREIRAETARQIRGFPKEFARLARQRLG